MNLAPRRGNQNAPKPHLRCPNCGKPNHPNAEWCWVCYGQLRSGDNVYVARLAVPVNDHSRLRTDRRLVRSRFLNVILGTMTTLATVMVIGLLAAILFAISVVIGILQACSGILNHGP